LSEATNIGSIQLKAANNEVIELQSSINSLLLLTKILLFIFIAFLIAAFFQTKKQADIPVIE